MIKLWLTVIMNKVYRMLLFQIIDKFMKCLSYN